VARYPKAGMTSTMAMFWRNPIRIARRPLPVVLVLIAVCPLRAAESDGSNAAAETAAPQQEQPPESLEARQRHLADEYKRLENVLLRMAELTAATDPRRAALLKKVVAQSKQRLIDVQFEKIVELLAGDQLSRAEENQQKVGQDLEVLLKLLLSENRAKRIESEKARIRAYLKQRNQIINRQKSVQGRTASGDDAKPLAEEQARLAQDTGGLAKQIHDNEESGGEAGSPGEEKKPADDTLPGGEKEAGKKDAPPEGGPKDTSPGEKPSAEGSSQGSPQGSPEGSPQGQPAAPAEAPAETPPEEQNPARQRIEAARKRMREAEQKLRQAEREGATQRQEEAIRDLEQAKAELEAILRQLREEEIEQMLTALEARFAKMLEMQREVYLGTQRLDKAAPEGLSHDQEIEAGRLSSREAEIVLEADKALVLLHEDGTAVAFPEALSQAGDDMRQVVERLAQAKVGQITQGIEEEIIAALEEMRQALQQALEDAEQRRQQQGEMPPGEPQDPSLVDLLAELRMIRALQLRVNTRTQRYSKLITGSPADNSDLLDALKRLAKRQERIQRITRDLELGRNQ